MNKEKRLENILTIVIGFILLYLIFKVKVLLTIAFVIGLSELFFIWLSEKIVQGWLLISKVLGAINSRILLSVVFFLFLVPIAFIYRMFNKDGLHLKRTEKNSYYHTRNHQYIPSDLENSW